MTVSIEREQGLGVAAPVPNGTGTANGIAPCNHDSGHNKPDRTNITISMNNECAFTPRKLRVVTIGAGYSGLTLAHKLRYQHPDMENMVTHTIFESRSDIGGTWLANTYPGVQCDVPAHIYVGTPRMVTIAGTDHWQAFPFDPNPNWNRFYASGQEIHQYMKEVVKKWDLDRDVQLNTKVVGAYWQEDSGQWKLEVEKESVRREEYADILISAQGFLK